MASSHNKLLCRYTVDAQSSKMWLLWYLTFNLHFPSLDPIGLVPYIMFTTYFNEDFATAFECIHCLEMHYWLLLQLVISPGTICWNSWLALLPHSTEITNSTPAGAFLKNKCMFSLYMFFSSRYFPYSKHIDEQEKVGKEDR